MVGIRARHARAWSTGILSVLKETSLARSEAEHDFYRIHGGAEETLGHATLILNRQRRDMRQRHRGPAVRRAGGAGFRMATHRPSATGRPGAAHRVARARRRAFALAGFPACRLA